MPAAATCRLFLALWPGAATRRALLAERDRWAWPAHARPTAAGDLHLTLHFIGPVPVDQVPTLVRTLAVAAPRFTLHPGDHAQWGEHVAVLEPAPPPAGLMVLHERLHVTLARTHGPIEPPPGGAAPWRWPVASYVLAQSVPGRPYRVLARFRLGAAARKHATAAAR
jgi:2'-5' RNA ligase